MKGLFNILLSLLAVLALTQAAVVKRWAAISSLSEDDDGDNNGDLTKRWLEPSSYGGAEPSYIKRAIDDRGQGQEFPEFPVNDVGEFEGEAVPHEDNSKEAPSTFVPFSPKEEQEEAKFEEVKDNEIDVDEKVPKEPKKVYDDEEEPPTTTTNKPWHKKAWHYLRDKVFKFGRNEPDTVDYDLDDY